MTDVPADYNYYSGGGGSGGYGYGGYGYGGVDPYGYGYGNYYQAYYNAAWQAYQQQQSIDNALVAQMQGIASNMMGYSNSLRQEWENTFIPEVNKLIADANSYASAARIQLEMGKAESQVAQAFDAQRQNALKDLESFGIDPSSGRYASLDAAERTQEAAAQAGAGNVAYQQTEAIARALRSEAIQATANLPGYANSAAGVAAGALRFPPQPNIPQPPQPRPRGQNVPGRRDPWAGVPVGQGAHLPQVNPGHPGQGMGAKDRQPQQQQPQPGPPATGGAKTPANTSAWLPQPTNVPSEGVPPAGSNSSFGPDSNAFNPYNQMNAPDLPMQNPGYDPWANTPTDSSSWTAQPGSTVEGGAPSPESVGQFMAPDTYAQNPGYDPWAAYNAQFQTPAYTSYADQMYGTGEPADTGYGPSYTAGGGQDTSTGDLGYYGDQYNDYSGPVGGQTNESSFDNYGGGGTYDYSTGDPYATSYDPSTNYGYTNDNAYTAGGNYDYSTGDPTYYDPGSYGGGGGDFNKGGMIPFSASPSRGRKTDDIRAKVKQTKEPINVDAGEFIMPRHAVAYKGKQFFQKIIDDSKKFHARHGTPQARRPGGAIPMR